MPQTYNLSLDDMSHSLIRRSQSLHEVFPAVDAIVLLLGFCCVCAGDSLNVVLEVRVAEVSVITCECRLCEPAKRRSGIEYDLRNTVPGRVDVRVLVGRFNDTVNGALDGVVAPSGQKVAGIDDTSVLNGSGVDKLAAGALDLEATRGVLE